ncbi:MAG: tetratricopeptide repeat protein, partial [Chloroflexota bacterium]|nr:tetratricopeptide repeat protein [Chloroflexota bacterium]
MSRTEILLLRGEAYAWIGDRKQARHDYEIALATGAAGDRAAQWQAMMRLSASWSEGDHPKALRYAEEALALADAEGDAPATAHSLNRLGNFAIFAGQPFEAERYHAQALAIFASL